jgi:hypothetical protein
MGYDIADFSKEGDSIDAIIIYFSKAFDFVHHDRLLTKLAALRVDSRVVVWVREFLVEHTQRVRVGRLITKEVKVTSGEQQGRFLGPLMFLMYVNVIWRNIESSIRLFVEDCLNCRKIRNKNNTETSQKYLNTLWE